LPDLKGGAHESHGRVDEEPARADGRVLEAVNDRGPGVNVKITIFSTFANFRRKNGVSLKNQS
jgi:hypothetical protein